MPDVNDTLALRKDYPIWPQFIPVEMRTYCSWINWQRGERDGKPTKLPLRSIDGRLASVTNPLDWQSLDVAMSAASRYNVGLGYVFSKADPFSGIDLDATDEPATLQRQNAIGPSLNSYTERSPSGRGLHVITKAVLPGPGRRQGGIECYDTARFFTVTGNVFHAMPITERQFETITLWQSLGSDRNQTNVGIDKPQHYGDDHVIERALNANPANGATFRRLWRGDWRGMARCPSQSEADFELMLVIGYYSRNIEQTVRLFRRSELGKRDKAKRDGYVYPMAVKAMPPQIPTFGGWPR
jgi:primase-polymerase (primpol)-like protein